MPYQPINTSIPSLDLSSINNSITAVKTKLPFLLNLTAKDVNKRRKLGKKTLPFLNLITQACDREPKIIPPFIVLTDLKRDVQLLNDLQGIEDRLKTLLEGVMETRIAIQKQAVDKGSRVYDLIKSGDETSLPGIGETREAIAKIFERRGREKKEISI